MSAMDKLITSLLFGVMPRMILKSSKLSPMDRDERRAKRKKAKIQREARKK